MWCDPLDGGDFQREEQLHNDWMEGEKGNACGIGGADILGAHKTVWMECDCGQERQGFLNPHGRTIELQNNDGDAARRSSERWEALSEAVTQSGFGWCP